MFWCVSYWASRSYYAIVLKLLSVKLFCRTRAVVSVVKALEEVATYCRETVSFLVLTEMITAALLGLRFSGSSEGTG